MAATTTFPLESEPEFYSLTTRKGGKHLLLQPTKQTKTNLQPFFNEWNTFQAGSEQNVPLLYACSTEKSYLKKHLGSRQQWME